MEWGRTVATPVGGREGAFCVRRSRRYGDVAGRYGTNLAK